MNFKQVSSAEKATGIAAIAFFFAAVASRFYSRQAELEYFDILCFGLTMLCIGQFSAFRTVRKQLEKEGTN